MNRYTVQHVNLTQESGILTRRGREEVMNRPGYAAAFYALAGAYQALHHYGANTKEEAEALLQATAAFRNGTAKPDPEFYRAIAAYYEATGDLRDYVDSREQDVLRQQALKQAEASMKAEEKKAAEDYKLEITKRIRAGDPTVVEEIAKRALEERANGS